ncbi:MAG: hypothetical protein Q9166_006594 [cf. Caloplaca sp. 2 TL-2023]
MSDSISHPHPSPYAPPPPQSPHPHLHPPPHTISPHPPTTSPKIHTLPHTLIPTLAPQQPQNLAKAKTITITETIHESIVYVSFATEQHLLTVTDTIFVNKTVFMTDTVTHTATRDRTASVPILTLNPTPSVVTSTMTKTLAATGMNLCDSAAAASTGTTISTTPFQPIAAVQDEKLSGGAVAGAVIGSLLGVAAVMGVVFVGVRKWRAWKAKENRHMKGVELQRRWEVEQEMRGKDGEGV